MVQKTLSEWISFPRARGTLDMGRVSFQNLIRSGRLTVKRVPGARPRLLRSEVESLLKSSIRPAVGAGSVPRPPHEGSPVQSIRPAVRVGSFKREPPER